ncbi:uncharacterized protein PAE49_023559 [Odontesthes bonariensis]|uniref:uncharacterized protein LOC142371824 n=1 Tax=Odontesthes bonariensis TaxID=219752 RepID=UPI003F5887A7
MEEPWQVLCAGRASRAARAHGGNRGAGNWVHYSTAAAAPLRTFSLFPEKRTPWQLASSLQQIQRLEAANQRLEHQIQEESDRRRPREPEDLERCLRTASFLQEQIRERLSAQARLELQLLGAKLAAFALNARCEEEQERRSRLEAGLSDLSLLEEELKVHELPALRRLLNSRTHQLVELQLRHQQDTQTLLTQVLRPVAMETQTAESSHLLQQLDHLAQMSVRRRPKVMFDPSELDQAELDRAELDQAELDRAELEELRSRAAGLTEELSQLKTLVLVLETDVQEQKESSARQTDVLQRAEVSLLRELDSVLQAAAQQAADHQVLLGLRNRLLAEMQDYRRQPGGPTPERIPSQTVSESQFCSKRAPVVVPPSEPVQSIRCDSCESSEAKETESVLSAQLDPTGGSVLTESETSSESESSAEAVKDVENVADLSSKEAGCWSTTVQDEGPDTANLMNDQDTDGQKTEEVVPRPGSVQDEGPDTAYLMNDQDTDGQKTEEVVPRPGLVQDEGPDTVNLMNDQDTDGQKTEEVVPRPGLVQDEGPDTVNLMNDQDTDVQKTEEVVSRPGLVQDEGPDTVNLMNDQDTDVQKTEEVVPRPGSVQDEGPDTAYLMNDQDTDGQKTEEVVPRPGLVQDEGPDAANLMNDQDTDGQKTEEVVPRPGLVQDEGPDTANLMNDQDTDGQKTEEVVPRPGLVQDEGPDTANLMNDQDTDVQKTEEVVPRPGLVQDEGPDTANLMNDQDTDGQKTEEVVPRPGSVQDEGPDTVNLMNDQDTDGQKTEEVVQRPGSVQDEGPDTVNLMNDQDTDGQKTEEVVPRYHPGSVLSDVFREPNKLTEDAELVFSIADVVSDSNDGKEMLKEADKVEVTPPSGEVKISAAELNNEPVDLECQEVSRMSTSPTGSGVALSYCDSDECRSPKEADIQMSPTAPTVSGFSSDPSRSPAEAEVFISMSDRVFPQDEPEDLRSPDLLLSPNEGDTRLSPIEIRVYLDVSDEEEQEEDEEEQEKEDEEEEEELCQTLTEANQYEKPTERYILSTKEEDKSSSFSRDQVLPEKDRKANILLSEEDGKGFPVQRRGLQVGSSSGELERGSPSDPSIRAENEEHFGSGGQSEKTLTDSGNQRDGEASGTAYKNMKDDGGMCRGPAGRKETDWLFAKNVGKAKEGAGYGSSNRAVFRGVAHKEGDKFARNGAQATRADGQERFRHGSGDWMGYGHGLGCTDTSSRKSGSEETPSLAPPHGTNSPETGRFGRNGSGEWMIYGGSLRRRSSLDGSNSLPNKDGKEHPITAGNMVTSPPGTGRFSRAGSGEWMVYAGSHRHRTSLDGSNKDSEEQRMSQCRSIPKDNKEQPITAVNMAMSPPGTGRFSRAGSGEWMVYAGSYRHRSSLDGSNSLPNKEQRMSQCRSIPKDSKEQPITAGNMATSPPPTGRFSRAGSGEWMVYAGSHRHGTSLDGSNQDSKEQRISQCRSIPKDNKEQLIRAGNMVTSPPGTGRFSRAGSGEWMVYGGSTGRMSRAGSSDRISVGGAMTSPSSSYTSSGHRPCSGGSGGALGAGQEVRRSSSVGSGGGFGRISRQSSSPGTRGFTSTGSGEWKPVYGSSYKSSVGGAERSSGGATARSQRAPSPGGWSSVSGGGGGFRPGRASSGDRTSGSSGSGRVNNTGGRVISSSDRPMGSTGSGAGGGKERISVCKKAALLMAAAGRERSQERRSKRPQQQSSADSPFIQRWLSTGAMSARPADDITQL